MEDFVILDHFVDVKSRTSSEMKGCFWDGHAMFQLYRCVHPHHCILLALSDRLSWLHPADYYLGSSAVNEMIYAVVSRVLPWCYYRQKSRCDTGV